MCLWSVDRHRRACRFKPAPLSVSTDCLLWIIESHVSLRPPAICKTVFWIWFIHQEFQSLHMVKESVRKLERDKLQHRDTDLKYASCIEDALREQQGHSSWFVIWSIAIYLSNHRFWSCRLIVSPCMSDLSDFPFRWVLSKLQANSSQ